MYFSILGFAFEELCNYVKPDQLLSNSDIYYYEKNKQASQQMHSWR